MISTKNVEESKSYVSAYIKPGITICRVAHMEHATPEIGSAHIKLFLETRPMEELNNEPQKGEFSMYTTEKATKYTLSQIADIAKACGIPKGEIDQIQAEDWSSYVAQIKPMIQGKFLRWKFRGEEVLSKTTGKKWLKASLPTWSFVEPDTDTVGLTFDPEKDITKLPDHDVEDMAQTNTGHQKDDMPF